MNKPVIHIIGGGTAALFLAAKLNPDLFDIIIYDKNKAPGRKFLIAGDGGLNLSYNESAPLMQARYTPSAFFNSVQNHLGSEPLREWFAEIGIDTYVGSSNRIFPQKGIKPYAVLQAILNHLHSNTVQIKTEYVWKGFSENKRPLLEHKGMPEELTEGIVVFALGGASWKVSGSEGEWLSFFQSQGVSTEPFQAANCAFEIKWPESVKEKVQGQVLKNITVNCDKTSISGEVTLTRFGIEGSGIYPLSPQIRKQLHEHARAELSIDLKPVWTQDKLLQIFAGSSKNLTEVLVSKVKLPKGIVTLLKQVLTKDEFTNHKTIANYIKHFPMVITSLGPIDEAISTVGGIALGEVDEHFELKKLPKHYCIGEMLDWDAPTGGYLITACYAQASALADYLALPFKKAS